MKKIITRKTFKIWSLFTVLLGGMLVASAQTAGIPYQAYILDVSGGDIPGGKVEVPLSNANIVLEFEIRNENGVVEYKERKNVITDDYGMVSTVVGVGGTPLIDTFDDIDWNGNSKKMHIDIDFSATGNSMQDHGVMDIIYIPGPSGKGGFGAPFIIKGSLDSEADLPTTGNENGDGYLINGELYLWVDTKFKNVGNVQGPQGE